MWQEIYDCFIDALYMLPFLFVLYILIELLEHKTAVGRANRLLTGRAAPAIGAAAGLIPMCGFSVMASKLYERRYLTLGTLLAVFISTNDEAFLVLALSPELTAAQKAIDISLLCAVKLAVAVGVGYLADFLFRRRTVLLPPTEEHEHEHDHDHENEHEGEEEPQACEHKHKGNVQVYVLSPLLHALKIWGIIFAIQVAFGLMFEFIGKENVLAFLTAGLWYQPLVCCLVGLIPNCASSVLIAEAFTVGSVAFGSCLGGLVTNAGLGIFVLFKRKESIRRNLLIMLSMFAIGLAVAYLTNAVMLLI